MRLIDADKLINAIELLKIEFYQYEESPILDAVISIINADAKEVGKKPTSNPP